MPDQYEILQRLMNSDGHGEVKNQECRTHAWTHAWKDQPIPAGHQVIHGFATHEGSQVATSVIVKSPLAFDADEAKYILSWYMAEANLDRLKKTLHQSQKVKKAPAGMLGYLHLPKNKLFAITGIDEMANVIEIPTQGKVNDGWHIFD